jgi:hypothetical protein
MSFICPYCGAEHGCISGLNMPLLTEQRTAELAELASLRAQVKALEADAGRYRWLRDQVFFWDTCEDWLDHNGDGEGLGPDDCDALIDAAMKEKP